MCGDELTMEQRVQSSFHRGRWPGTCDSLIEEDHLLQAVKICRAIRTMPEVGVDRAAGGRMKPKVEIFLDLMRNARAWDHQMKAAV